MNIEIEESGMTFGPFLKKEVFYVEKSINYQKIQKSIKIAEFMYLKTQKHPTLWIVEAKSSAPAPDGKNHQRFSEFLDEIKQKFINTLDLGFSTRLGRHPW